MRSAHVGGGTPVEQIDVIFDLFVQVDQRLTLSHVGIGRGLAIGRDLARGTHGNLTVESTAGVGSIFTLSLPRA